jgi:16S rRNA (guanine527-N7)-methyltransferase
MNEVFWQYEEILTQHLRFVLERNKQVNLTGIDSFDAGILLHVEDSLTALPEVESAPEGIMLDIGSGAGFPGIPLAVASGRKTILVESIAKKAAVLQAFIDSVDLMGQISVVSERSEEVAAKQPEVAAVVTARAVSELPVLVELASPLLCDGGVLVALKGSPTAEELERGVRAGALVGMELVAQRCLTLSDAVNKRTIVVFKKVDKPSIVLPRRAGMAAKRPLA